MCLHLNFETKHSKVGMFDSGCNNPMQVLTDDVRACVGEFTSDASGTLGIMLTGISPAGSAFAFEKMQLVRNLSYNLFP